MGFILGVDFGQKADFSAVVIAEYPQIRSEKWRYATGPKHLYLSTLSTSAAVDAVRSGEYVQPDPGDKSWPLHVIHVDRWHRGTPYPTIVGDVGNMVDSLQAGIGKIPVATIVDATGVGVAIVDLLNERNIRHLACTITGGTIVNYEQDRRSVSVPKRDLVMSAVAMLETGRLRWPAGREAMIGVMEDELRNFQMKYSVAGNELFEADRKEHDDLVLALAMATWFVSSGGPFYKKQVRVRAY